MQPYDKARVNRYWHASRLLRERGWQGVGDWPGTWQIGWSEVTFEKAIRLSGIERGIQEAIFAERRASIVRAFGQVSRHVAESFDAVKRSVEKLSRSPAWRRAIETDGERGKS